MCVFLNKPYNRVYRADLFYGRDSHLGKEANLNLKCCVVISMCRNYVKEATKLKKQQVYFPRGTFSTEKLLMICFSPLVFNMQTGI